MVRKNKLGISVYPELQEVEDIKKYIKLAHKYGFTRLFTSLLQIDEKNKEEMSKKMKDVCLFARSNDFEVILDVSPRVFNVLGIKLPDVKFFEDMGASTIRLDMHLDGYTEKKIIDSSNLNIEINMSSLKSIGNLLRELKIPKDRIVASHNFYPQRYSGLDMDYFIEISKHYKELDYRTTAFITSHGKDAKVGPWPINEGLCTLEEHRDLKITTQAKHFFAMGFIDDLIIGNAFASEEELKELSELDPNKIELDVMVEKETTNLEEKILFDYKEHFRRPDINSYIIRSTITRVIYKEHDFKPIVLNKKKQEYGEIYIGNNDFKNYKGELHLVIKEMPYDGRKNLVGRIVKEEEILIPFIESSKSFCFKKVKGGK